VRSRPPIMIQMLQRRPSIIKSGGLEREGFESGLLKMGIERGRSLKYY